MHLLGLGLPTVDDPRVVVALPREAQAAVDRHPAHHLRRHEVLRLAPHLPDALVGLGEPFDRLVDEVAEALPHLGRDLAATPLVRAHCVEQHPPHVVLVLVERAVADAHRPRVAVAREVVERVLGEVGLATDAVHDLQVGLARRHLRCERLEHEREVLERLPLEAEVVERARA